jgi:hypothetical protein
MKYQDLATDFLNKALQADGWREDRKKINDVYSDDSFDAVIIERQYSSYFSCATWVSCKQRLFLVSLAQQYDKDCPSYCLPNVNGVSVSIGYIDQKTGATTIKFERTTIEVITREQQKKINKIKQGV